MDTDYILGKVMLALTKSNRPMTTKQIIAFIRANNMWCHPPSVRVIICLAVKSGVLTKFKVGKIPNFYCKKEWLDSKGNVLVPFDPYSVTQ